MDISLDIFKNILIVMAGIEIMWGIGIITYMLVKHRSKLQLSFLNIVIIYITAMNPFAVRDLSRNVANYLEEL